MLFGLFPTLSTEKLGRSVMNSLSSIGRQRRNESPSLPLMLDAEEAHDVLVFSSVLDEDDMTLRELVTDVSKSQFDEDMIIRHNPSFFLLTGW